MEMMYKIIFNANVAELMDNLSGDAIPGKKDQL
jgi:hypothetical protein